MPTGTDNSDQNRRWHAPCYISNQPLITNIST